MNMRTLIVASLIVLSVAVARVVAGQPRDKLGKVEFPTSCSPAVQEKLLRSIAENPPRRIPSRQESGVSSQTWDTGI